MASFASRLSPITRRRLAAFKANRRARVSLWLFGTLFIVSLFAELIANDKPIIMQYDGQWYVPMLVDYPETEFDGFLPTRTDYLDPFIQQQIKEHGWALWPVI
ncbi:MAG: ABC transporter permease, partial [Halomonas sp.]